MPRHEESPLPEGLRREIFLALVKAQDGGTPVPQSRRAVAGQFGVNEEVVRQVEREGLDGSWPPLGQPEPDSLD
jgi:hypothetical protein